MDKILLMWKDVKTIFISILLKQGGVAMPNIYMSSMLHGVILHTIYEATKGSHLLVRSAIGTADLHS